MSKLRSKIKREDVRLWVRWFIDSVRDRRLQPRGEDAVARIIHKIYLIIKNKFLILWIII